MICQATLKTNLQRDGDANDVPPKKRRKISKQQTSRDFIRVQQKKHHFEATYNGPGGVRPRPPYWKICPKESSDMSMSMINAKDSVRTSMASDASVNSKKQCESKISWKNLSKLLFSCKNGTNFFGENNEYETGVVTFFSKVNTVPKASELNALLKESTRNENFADILQQYVYQGKIGQPEKMIGILKQRLVQPSITKYGVTVNFPNTVLQHTRLQEIMKIDDTKPIEAQVQRIQGVENMFESGKSNVVVTLDSLVENDQCLIDSRGAIRGVTIEYTSGIGRKYASSVDINIYTNGTFTRYSQPSAV